MQRHPIQEDSKGSTDVLVSNFNNQANLQGTGTTIAQVSPGTGSTKLFAQINAGQLPLHVTVLRIELAMLNSAKPLPMSRTIVGSGFSERADPAALVIELDSPFPAAALSRARWAWPWRPMATL